MHRYLVLYGGRGSSKTHHILLKLLLLTFNPNHINILYCRKNLETIRATLFKDLQHIIKLSKLHNWFTYSTAFNSSMIFTNNITGHTISPYGLVDSKKTKGISQATHIFVDEITENDKESIDMIDSILRTPAAEHLQFIAAFNPIDRNNFIHDYFFDENDQARPDYGDKLLVHHSTVYDNEYINVDEYVDSMKRRYAHSKNLLDVNLYGKWGKNEVNSPFIYRMPNVDKVQYTGGNYLISMDYNKNPMTALLCELKANELIILKEFLNYDSHPDKFTEYLLSNGYPINVPVVATGDATGNVRTATSQYSVFASICSKLRITPSMMRTPKFNISHANSRMICNESSHRITINSDCKVLLSELNDIEYINNSIDKSDLKRGHILDCYRYAVHYADAKLKLRLIK